MRLDEQILTLQIWDTAGGERFQSLGRAFYRGADCCVIVFDCSRRQTFEKLNDYKEEFEKQSLDLAPNFPYAVVRNKTDLQGDVVTEEQTRIAVKRAFGEHCAYFSTSAKVPFRHKSACDQGSEKKEFGNGSLCEKRSETKLEWEC